ncbi:MFS family permease [Bradyrhizobium sp. i1.8.4]
MAHFAAVRNHRLELRNTAALTVVGMLLATAFGLSTLITPLYLIYQKAFGFSQITLTLIYAVYAIGNIAALLLFGSASDRAGRRATALSAIAVLIGAALVLLFARGTAWLYAGRILSGLGVGLASGTGNAWLAELVGEADKGRAAIIGTSTNFLGLGVAAVLSGLLAQYAPWPLQLSFVVYLVIACAVAGLIWFTRETVQHPDRGQIEIQPKLALPRKIQAQFVAPAITGFGLMALVGFYASLMPSILLHDLRIENRAAGGALLFELALVVALVIVATQMLASRTSMLWSLALMIPAAAAIVVAQVSASLWVMLAATIVVAVSTGLGYRGSLQVVNQIAPADQRAAVVSTYFVCCFIGNALPVIGVGVLSSLTNTTVADIAFACTIAAFAAIALTFGLLYQR